MENAMEEYLNQFKNCLQNEAAFCTAACPFHLDMRDFAEKIGRGGYNAAFKAFRNAVGFPEIVAALCHAPCKDVCPRKDTDSAIALNMMEKACLAYATKLDPTDYNVPVKNRKIAVIGAGISGLACVLRLSTKKYALTVYEKSDRIGGHLWGGLPEEVLMRDIEHQFKYEKYTLVLNTLVDNLEELKGYDVIYVATGADGKDYGLLNTGSNPSLLYGKTAVFMGGSLLGKGTIEAIADGLNNAAAIERYLRTGMVMPFEDNRSTNMRLDPAKLIYQEPVVPEADGLFSKEEAQAEANRCLRCQCDACRNYCDLTDFYNKWPARIKDEVVATIRPGSADIKTAIAKRLIYTSNLEGICKDVCPVGIDLDGMLLLGRKILHKHGKHPWVFHDFWLQDMDCANSEKAAVARAPKGFSKSKYALFPGCQLGASDPAYVLKTYEYLLRHEPDTALLLHCCGAPAEWAGDEEKHKEVIEKIRSNWNALGCPKIILACPTCKQKFDTFLPELPVVFLYDVMAAWGIGTGKGWDGQIYSIFDPCSSRHEPELRDSIRKLSTLAGYATEPLPANEGCAKCCSFGGQASIANPEFAESVITKRIAESSNPYITYCINCRDIFAAAGKPVLHILDILFGIKDQDSELATVTERRQNRFNLKNVLLKEFWGEEVEREQKPIDDGIRLLIGSRMKAQLDKERILESDIGNVIRHCENTGQRILHLETGNYSGHKEIGHTTYWVEYQVLKGEFELVNAYYHRMRIELEAVWNGKRTDVDV